MNVVPVLFLERVVFHINHTKTLLDGCNLSGKPGLVASEAYAKRYVHSMWLRNGRLENERYLTCEGATETPSRKHIHYTGISICADKMEYSTDPEATHTILSAAKGTHVLVSVGTSNISKEISKCVDSIRFVFNLKLYTKITSDVLKIMRSLVEKNTLNEMSIGEEVEVDDQTAQLLVTLLKQKQFHRLFLRGECSAALKEIIASWRENSEEMMGKMVYCKKEFSELQFSSTEFPIEECTEEEKRLYYLLSRWPNITTKSVLRNQDGSAVYCFLRPYQWFLFA